MKKGQIWVETVLYTIIIMAIIALILAFTMPAINKQKDEVIVKQSIDSLRVFDEKIKEVSKETGNVRIIEFSLKKGELIISAVENNITLAISDLSSLYSQPDVMIKDGSVNILSTEGKKTQSVNLSLNYNLNITYEDKDVSKRFTPVKIAYRFVIENKDGIIDIREANQG